MIKNSVKKEEKLFSEGEGPDRAYRGRKAGEKTWEDKHAAARQVDDL